MVTQAQSFFGLVVAGLAIQRVLELRRSARNQARLIDRGGFEVAPGHFWAMKLVHIAWFCSMIVEVYAFGARFNMWACAAGILGLIAGQLLRLTAIHTLGERWTVRIMILPDTPVVTSGIYRYIRHPNYLGVILEILFVPMIHGAYWTAIVFSILNALVLRVRVAAEEVAWGIRT